MASEKLSGGCLCGAVRYRIEGEARAFYHCHCRRCRKATGSGHASNIIIAGANIDWEAGEDKLKSHRVPDAERFRNVFCRDCGGPLPRVAPDGRFTTVPAGSLDTEPDTPPTGRIFWASRAAWSCADAALPVWPEYPDRG